MVCVHARIQEFSSGGGGGGVQGQSDKKSSDNVFFFLFFFFFFFFFFFVHSLLYSFTEVKWSISEGVQHFPLSHPPLDPHLVCLRDTLRRFFRAAHMYSKEIYAMLSYPNVSTIIIRISG